MSSLDELKMRIKEMPISSVISNYLTLTKKGTQTLAVCPFHDDHNPSMQVNDQKNMFYCFVDQMGGDAIKFVQLYKNLNYIEALQDICQALGWNYDEYQQEKKSNPRFELGKKILGNSAKFYHRWAQTKKAAGFEEFVTNRLNGNRELADAYQLGYAPANNALSQYFNSIKDPEEKQKVLQLALELGIIKPDKYREDSQFDTFRERIMFPIWDQFGQVIGFTSRAIKDSQMAKYMNSVDSFLFNKRQLLYGLHLAKSFIRERDAVIIAEGNMDQISLYAHGFEHSVAIMGVALGDTSLKKLLGLTKNIYLCLDNDKAGFKAGQRINQQFMEYGITPRYISLNEHKDPDDFIKIEGHLALQKNIEEARPFIDEEIDRQFPEKVPELSDRKLEILQNFFNILRPLKQDLKALERVQLLAKRLGLQSDSQTITKTYQDFLKGEQEPRKAGPGPTSAPIMETPPEDMMATPAPLQRQITKAESKILQQIVLHPEILDGPYLADILDFVTSDEVKTYISKLADIFFEIEESEYINVLTSLNNSEEYSVELTGIIGAAIYQFRPQNLDEKACKKLMGDLKRKLKEEDLKAKKQTLKEMQKNLQTESELKECLLEMAKIDRELLSLR